MKTLLSGLTLLLAFVTGAWAAGESNANIAALPKLPGKRLAQHDFLYRGERDTRKANQTIFLIKSGKVVWAIHQWENPDLGPASCIQLLDEPGRAEEMELRR